MEGLIDDGVAVAQLSESLATVPGLIPPPCEQEDTLDSLSWETNMLAPEPELTTEMTTPPKRPPISQSHVSQPPKKKPSLSWKRRKEELQRLRSETQAMQTHVAFLSLKKTYELMLDENLQTPAQKQWKATALAERKRCQEANDENARLKQDLQRCIQSRNTLQNVLTTAEASQQEQLWGKAVVTEALQVEMRMCYKMELQSSVVFDLLERCMDKRLCQVGDIFRDGYISPHDPESDQVRVHRSNDKEADAMVELTRSRVMPFAAEKVSTAAWSLIQRGVTSEELAGRIVRGSEDSVASLGQFTYHLKDNGVVQAKVYSLMRKMPVPGGFVGLIESVTEWLADISSSSPWRYASQDSGWIMVRPIDSTSASLELCHVQSSIRLRSCDALFNDEPSKYPSAPSLLTRSVSEVVISFFRKTMSSKHQLLDNELLDNSRR